MQRHSLGLRPGIALGSDTRRAARLARTRANQLSSAREKQRVHLEQRLAESDAAGIVVVDEDVGIRRQRRWNAAGAAGSRRTLERAAIN